MKNKIIFALMVVIIIAGIAVTAVKGLNLGLEYSKATSVDVDLNQEFDNKELRKVVREVMGENTTVKIKKIEVYQDMASIILNEISDEQFEQLKNKLQERYNIELDDTTIVRTEIQPTNIVEMFMPYVEVVSIITGIVFAYEAVRYYKKGIIKAGLKSLEVLVMPTAVVFSLIAITRMPVSRYTIPALLLSYLISVFASSLYIEKMPNKEKIEK